MKLSLLLTALIAFGASPSAFALGNGCYKFSVDTFRNGGGLVTYYLWIGRNTYKVEAGNLESSSLVEAGICGKRESNYATTSYSAYCSHLARLGQRCDLQ